MQREILFKAKDIYLGKWFEGVPVESNIDDSIDSVGYKKYLFINNCYHSKPNIMSLSHHGGHFGYVIEVDPKTVCEYAGFSDKNGKEVFEGDYDKEGNIVVFCDECHGWQFGQIDIPTKQICIPCHNCDGNFMIGDWIDRFKVVGNIND